MNRCYWFWFRLDLMVFYMVFSSYTHRVKRIHSQWLKGWTIISSFRSQLRTKLHQSSGGRHMRIIISMGKIRGHSSGRHEETREMMRNWVHFLGEAQQWPSSALWLLSIAGLSGQFWTWLKILSKHLGSADSSHVLPSPSYCSLSHFLQPLSVSLFIFLFYYLLSISPET